MPNWKKVIVSGSNAALNSLNVSTSFTASGLIYPTADNGEESFIQTDGNGTLSLQYVKTIYEEIYNGEATQLVKGTPVYVSGSVGAAAQVFRADAGNPAKMPVIYISADTLAAGETGRGIALGLIKGIDLTGYTAGTEIYVGVGGGWTSTRPTGSAIVQTLGYVTKEGNGGQGVVLNPGPNSLPNLPSGSVWVGNSSSIPTAVLTSSLSVASASFASTASFLGSTTNGFIQNGNSFGTTATLGTNDNQSLQFETNGTTKMFISSSGNVGIGLTNPIRKLDVLGGATFGSSQGAVEIGNSGTTGYISGHNGLIISTNHLNVGLASGEKVRITSVGDVGIGTTSPTFRLDVLTPNISTFRTKNSTTAAANTINIHNDSDLGLNATIYGSAYIAGSWLNLGANGVALFSNSTANFGILTSTNTSLIFGTNNTERIRITNGGNVGIGTTSPSYRLDVSGSGRVAGSELQVGVTTNNNGSRVVLNNSTGGRNWQLANNWNVGNSFEITPSTTVSGSTFTTPAFVVNGTTSNVGVGLTNPISKLHVSQNDTEVGANAGITIEQAGTGDAVVQYLIPGVRRWVTGIDNSDSDKFKISSTADLDADARLVIDTTGNVGIGTTTPNSRLDVNGNTTITGSLAVSQSLLQYSNIASVTSGSTSNVASFLTGSYTAAFFDYVTTSGTNARAGTVFTVWNANNVEFTETSTNDIGNASNLVLSASLSAGAIRLQATSLSGSWSVKTLARML